MSKSTHTLEDMLVRRPADREAIEAHKQRMLAEIAAHLDSQHDESHPEDADTEHEAAKRRSTPPLP